MSEDRFWIYGDAALPQMDLAHNGVNRGRADLLRHLVDARGPGAGESPLVALDLPIYCNGLTAEVLRHGPLALRKNWRIFQTGSDFSVGDVEVQTFSVPHDAADPVGFVLGHGDCSFGVLTDLGFATKLVHERIRPVQTLRVRIRLRRSPSEWRP